MSGEPSRLMLIEVVHVSGSAGRVGESRHDIEIYGLLSCGVVEVDTEDNGADRPNDAATDD